MASEINVGKAYNPQKLFFKGYDCTTAMEALRTASKCNAVPEKQHDLLNNKVGNNTVMKLLTKYIQLLGAGFVVQQKIYLCPLITH
jgi:hypothetical protein